ncbi:Glutathione S-transferase [Mycena kentingensis (nom. inval.)]|nr:Glutathione S-transferase [Mycena kentingensis (nom. inval.)]
MVLTLYGFDNPCGSTAVVATILTEKEIPYEFVPISLRDMEHKSEAFLEIQPFGQVPYIDDDGFILYESVAICRYLLEKYPEKGVQGLLPAAEDIKAKAIFEQAASVQINHFHTHAYMINLEAVYKPEYGIPVDEHALTKAKLSFAATLGAYEKILGKQKYLAGDRVTLVDLLHLGFGTLMAEAGVDMVAQRPNVKRWWEEISRWPSYMAYGEVVRARGASSK